jgi:hypothetical protein
MLLKYFTLFYIKDKYVGNSVDFIKKKKKKKKDSPLRLLLWVIICDVHVTFMGREEREENNYFAKFYRKKMKRSERCKI